MSLPRQRHQTIWIFNHYANSPDQPGGTRHYDLALELVNRGYNVVIFAAGFSHRERRELKLIQPQKWTVENINGVKFVWLKTFPYYRNGWRRFANMLSFMFRAGRLAKRLPELENGTGRPDIIIGSSVHLFAVAAAAGAAGHFGCRFFMEVRDIWPQTLVDMKAISKIHPFFIIMRLLEKRLYRRAEAIITPLPLASGYFEQHGIAAERILYLPQGTPLANRDHPPAPRRSDSFTIAYVGSFGPADGVDILIRAAGLLGGENIKLVFVGDGEDKPHLMNWAAKLELANIEFKDPMPKKAVRGWLQSVDACITHLADLGIRHKYGIALNKLIDYAAAGKPVIFAGSVPNDMISAAGCGFSVAPGDPRLVAEAIKKLAAMDGAALAKMGERGRTYVAQNHSIPELVDKLEGLWAVDHSSGKQERSRPAGVVTSGQH